MRLSKKRESKIKLTLSQHQLHDVVVKSYNYLQYKYVKYIDINLVISTALNV